MADTHPLITPTSIEFPFSLASDVEQFAAADDLHVRRMDDASRVRLLKIQDAKYDDAGRIVSFTSLPGCLISVPLAPELDLHAQFCSSNYVLTARSLDRAVDFNFALKLVGSSCSSLYLGYQSNSTTHFINPPCYFGTAALKVSVSEVEILSSLISQTPRRRIDAKLGIMSEMYMHALSCEPRKESRFIEMSIIMEMLLLPKSSAELSYRFALRLAKLLNKRFGQDPWQAFTLGKKIYKTRSNLVHSGRDSSLDDVAQTAYDTARTLLLAYVQDNEAFNEDALDALCLGS